MLIDNARLLCSIRIPARALTHLFLCVSFPFLSYGFALFISGTGAILTLKLAELVHICRNSPVRALTLVNTIVYAPVDNVLSGVRFPHPQVPAEVIAVSGHASTGSPGGTELYEPEHFTLPYAFTTLTPA